MATSGDIDDNWVEEIFVKSESVCLTNLNQRL